MTIHPDMPASSLDIAVVAETLADTLDARLNHRIIGLGQREPTYLDVYTLVRIVEQQHRQILALREENQRVLGDIRDLRADFAHLGKVVTSLQADNEEAR